MHQLLGTTLGDIFLGSSLEEQGIPSVQAFFLLNKPESLQNEVTKEWDFAKQNTFAKVSL